MFRINRLRLEIKTKEQESSKDIFGFDIPFEHGLNIVAGHNSKGKTTINSCIYYSLGMEELLGGQNEKALDKAVKSEFNIYEKASGKVVKSYSVFTSKVLVEISNTKGEIVTVRRYINPGQDDAEGRELAKTVTVYNDEYSAISSNTRTRTLYIRGANNNDNDFGFYSWFAEFIGVDLPIVSNSSKKDGYSPLYLQAIFPSLFIEQTKGWSDFFATTPYFGIPKTKEKVVEFLLNLNELNTSTEKDKIGRTKRDLEIRWKFIYNKLELLSAEYDGLLKDVPENITKDKDVLKTTNLFIKDKAGDLPLPINQLIETKEKSLQLLRQKPLVRVGDNKEEARISFENTNKEYDSFLKKFKSFDQNFGIQKEQLVALQKHQKDVVKELSSQKGIQKVFDQAIIKEDVYSKCPTCTQHISVDLMSSENIKIEKLSLQENIAYLDGQRKLIQSSIDSLEKVIKEKETVRKYYVRQQRELEDEIKILLKELVADDREFSESDTLIRVRLEKSISEFQYLYKRFKEDLKALEELAGSYYELLKDEDKLNKSHLEDKLKLNEFEKAYKLYLENFKYSSNPIWNISIQDDDPFKYFPVFKFRKDDAQPQSIRVNSSASDFVRNIWAYSISLLQKGENHPGLVLFDEPGQHRTDSASLKALFEECAAIRDKQIIIFTSVDKNLGDDDKIDLTDLLKDLKREEDYYIYELDEVGKSIKFIETN
ncbi:hypothetical protein Q4E40_01020 [Pontibacter sp. BT731]|uniref:AAA family ATPase n=1 Tax=Pontibacter coccineus TaxID=3063328 RepID=UPI0026E48279|nr:AAA family ATPase [Pontibacter sp. BT731]MDO6388686.1 hypothetical protein [Pontibacter sp. BT731]